MLPDNPLPADLDGPPPNDLLPLGGPLLPLGDLLPSSDPPSIDPHSEEPYTPQIPYRTHLTIDLAVLAAVATLKDLQDSIAFIQAIRGTSLDDDVTHMSPTAIECLQNPPPQ
jgi:hypothetical protein